MPDGHNQQTQLPVKAGALLVVLVSACASLRKRRLLLLLLLLLLVSRYGVTPLSRLRPPPPPPAAAAAVPFPSLLAACSCSAALIASRRVWGIAGVLPAGSARALVSSSCRFMGGSLGHVSGGDVAAGG